MTKCALALIALVAVAACGTDTDKAEPSSGGPASTVEVVYEVTGDTKSAGVTVTTGTGTSQKDVAVPLVTKSGSEGIAFQMRPGARAYISAQNRDRYGSGPITCRIRVNGRILSENSSTGQFSIATCSVTV